MSFQFQLPPPPLLDDEKERNFAIEMCGDADDVDDDNN